MNGTYSVLVLVSPALLAVFVLPTIIGAWKRHPYFWLIMVVNFAGGTVVRLAFGRVIVGLGWLAALALALWPAERSQIDWNARSAAAHPGGAITPHRYEAAREEAVEPLPEGGPSFAPATKTCPECGDTVPAEVGICKSCFHRFESEPTIA